jgi:hypothetical protein
MMKTILNSLLRQVGRALARLWYLQPPTALLLHGTPNRALHDLALAARPSTERLHLRDFFRDGRRYYVYRHAGGFAMQSNRRIPWMRRRRTRMAAVLLGTFSEFGSSATGLRLRARLSVPFFLDIFPLPLIILILLLAGPMPTGFALLSGAALLILSWLWHRYTAVMQILDMQHFVRAALAEIEVLDAPELPASAAEVVSGDASSSGQSPRPDD